MSRQPNTQNEMTQNAETFNMRHIRPRRRGRHFPTEWDESPRLLTGSWKATTKSRHQWAKRKRRICWLPADETPQQQALSTTSNEMAA